MIDRAMVLAAGLGKRMGALTANCPKPLLQLGQQAIIDHVLDRLAAARLERVVVNLHYKADMVRTHLQQRADPAIVFSPEDDLLETGGGIQNALPFLGDKPFFVANADTVWRDGAVPALQLLQENWDEARMQTLLLLVPTPENFPGDYERETDGRLVYRPNGKTASYIYAGLNIATKTLFIDAPSGAYSLKKLWDKAEVAGGLYGLVHDSAWYHLGTPEELMAAQADFA